MPLTRDIARECAKEGLLVILQKGTVLDPHQSAFKGPIRLRVAVPPEKAINDDDDDDKKGKPEND